MEALPVEYRPRSLTVPGFCLTPLGLIPEGEPTFEQWQGLAPFLCDAQGAVHWWIGDWLNYAEQRWGHMYQQVVQSTGFDYQTLADDKWLSSKIQFSSRKENLSHKHHKVVAGMEVAEQVRWLSVAEEDGLTAAQFRSRVAQAGEGMLPEEGCTDVDLATLASSGKRFGTVYVDPPWCYDNRGTRAAAGNHYDTLPVADLAALPVGNLAAEEAHLHLWTTNAFLRDAFGLVEAWGFEYRSTFVWCKTQMGIGNYWRVSHEFLLLGIRGRCGFRDKSLRSWAEISRGEHSAKPEQVRLMIEKASPEPRLELFGRRPAPGWTVWGNQIERDLFFSGTSSGETTHEPATDQ